MYADVQCKLVRVMILSNTVANGEQESKGIEGIEAQNLFADKECDIHKIVDESTNHNITSVIP
ncbi:hypothetical protein [Holospora curviuscula]|uniref:Uncharacterized protein n=1 Tax=Holospora curviuscula TaxID=1082868 RepID=A0A2S5RAX9_9PROT|nr:hypothetical protein [Holospora curviuscula]PPE04285.1 hypothetical protein HCUR_00476 [Holospora curviuscula]